MTDGHRLRAIILDIQDHLSDTDRQRLHFHLGGDVPRRIRDDPSLHGTLNLTDSLFDRGKISDEHFTFLISAFDEIHCINAVKVLKSKFLFFLKLSSVSVSIDHSRRNQSNEISRSIRSLSLIMPHMMDQLVQDQDDEPYPSENRS